MLAAMDCPVAPPTRLQRGAAAEALAAGWLESRGFKVLARNLRCRAGELDIVGLDGEILVIVEVRLRSRRDFGGALASVNPAKQRRLIRATRFHWQRQPSWRSRVLRFDVLALQRGPDGKPGIEWVKDAFRAT
jgi:putative endonuclease